MTAPSILRRNLYPHTLDHTGKVFGRLIAKRPTSERIRGQIAWECECTCGEITLVGATDLKAGLKKSCGCLTAWKGYGEISGAYWCHLRTMAEKRSIPLEITIEQAWALFLKQERKCAYTGWLLKFRRDFAYGRGQSASLDRIDSSRSYTPDNIQWVHLKINLMKGTLSHDEFLALCASVQLKRELR